MHEIINALCDAAMLQIKSHRPSSFNKIIIIITITPKTRQTWRKGFFDWICETKRTKKKKNFFNLLLPPMHQICFWEGPNCHCLIAKSFLIAYFKKPFCKLELRSIKRYCSRRPSSGRSSWRLCICSVCQTVRLLDHQANSCKTFSIRNKLWLLHVVQESPSIAYLKEKFNFRLVNSA